MKTGGRANVSLHIERLVIAGVPLAGSQAVQLQRAMERELVRLLRRDGMGDAIHGGATPTVVTPVVHMSTPLRPAEVGRHIARSVHESLTRSL